MSGDATTVRMRVEDKARLDRVQAQLTLKTGKRVALDAVLHAVIRVAERHMDELDPRDLPPRLSDARWDRIMAMPRDLGETDAGAIDDVLYGPRADGPTRSTDGSS